MKTAGELSTRSVIARLLRLLAPDWPTLTAAAFSALAAVGAGVGLIATSAYLISAAALLPPFGDLQMAVVAVRFFGLSRAGFRYLERLLSHSVNLGLLARLRIWVFERLEPLMPAQTGDLTSGDLLTRLVADIDSLENFYVRVVAPALTALLASVGMAVFLGAFHPSLAAVILVFLALAGVGIPCLAHCLGRIPGRRLVEMRATLNVRLVETVQGAANLLAFGQEQRWLADISALNHNYGKAQERMAWIQGLQTGLASLTGHLGMFALLVLAIPLVHRGAMSGTSLAVVVLAGLASFEAVAGLPLAAQYLEANLQSARRLFAVADRLPLIQDPAQPEPLPLSTQVTLRSVTFCYPSSPSKPALADVSLDLVPGQWIALVGESGAGKTSLVNLLLRFWDPTSGAIQMGGVDLRALRQSDLRRRIAVIAQTTTLFNASVRANLLLANPSASPEALETAARQAQIHERILALPQGYDTLIGERGQRLSTGERQRLAIARALLQDPALLILDEPSANLDAPTGQALFETLYTTVFPSRAVLLITHQLGSLARMSEILVLHHGRIVERGAQPDLLAQNGRFAHIYSLSRYLLEEEVQENLATDPPGAARHTVLTSCARGVCG
jgi:thiol reductant ABC exporter CydC subunit